MAGIGKYKKGAKFTLKSGNTPLFKQMGSGTPLYNTASVSTTSETTTSSTESEKEKDNEEEQVPVTPEKVPVTPDKPLAKAGKVMFNALAGGLNAIQKNKIKELKINFDKNEEKRKEEADSETPGEKAFNDAVTGDGAFKPQKFAEFTSDGKMIMPDDPKHSSNITKKTFKG